MTVYTEPALDRMRTCLLQYRVDKRREGRTLPWRRVAMDVLDADATPKAFYEKEYDNIALAESLRRFAARTQTLTPERLDVLSGFLTEAYYIKPGELAEDDAPTPLARSIRAFFGEGRSPAYGLERLCGRYMSVRQLSSGHSYSFLTIEADEYGQIRSHENEYRTLIRPQLKRTAELERTLMRTARSHRYLHGHVIEAPERRVIIVMTDPATKETLTYLVSSDGRNPQSTENSDTIALIKNTELTGSDRIEPLPDGTPALTIRREHLERLRRWFDKSVWQYRATKD